MAKDDFYTEFGQLLQTTRRRGPKRMTQEAFAKALGISRPSVANIEKGRQAVQLHLLVKMAEIHDVAPGDLIPQQPRTASDETRTALLDALQQQGASPRLLERARVHLSSGGN